MNDKKMYKKTLKKAKKEKIYEEAAKERERQLNIVFQREMTIKRAERSEFCTDSGINAIAKKSFKNISWKMFFVLLSSIFAVTGIYQLFIPYLLPELDRLFMDSFNLMIIIGGLILLCFILFVYIIYYKKSFRIMRWIVYLFLYVLFSVISNYITNFIVYLFDIPNYSVYVRFTIGLLFSLLTVFTSYCMTRTIICHDLKVNKKL